MPVELTVDQQALHALRRALDAEADGKQLRRELAKNMRGALEPAKESIKARLLGMGDAGVEPSEGPPLRVAVVQQLKVEARLSGRRTGASIRVKARGPRNFDLAGRRLNRAKGWRHKVFGRDVWVRQVGEVGYFDDPIQARVRQYRDAVLAAMESMARRIAQRAR